MDTTTVLLLALTVLAGAAVGMYWAAHPAVESLHEQAAAALGEVSQAAQAVQQMKPVIEVQAPHVEWPPLLTWLIAILTIASVVNAVSNIVDLRKLSKLYTVWRNGHKRNGRKEQRWNRSKRSGMSTGRSSSSSALR